MLARLGRLALAAIVVSAVTLTALVLMSIASGNPEPAPPNGRRASLSPGSAARPWLAPLPPDEYHVDAQDEPDLDVPEANSLPRPIVAIALALCLLLAIVAGALAAVVLASGPSLI